MVSHPHIFEHDVQLNIYTCRINDSIVTRAGSKIILCGEYVCIMKGCAMSIPMPYETSITLTPSNEDAITIDKKTYVLNDIKNPFVSSNEDIAHQAILHLIKRYQEHYVFPSGFSLKITSNIPQKSGFGSSASLLVAISKALIHFLKGSNDHLISFATEAEHFFHGKSSGFDIKACFSEKVMCCYDFEKTTYLESFTFPFFIIDTGPSLSSTKECVDTVMDQYDKTHFVWEDAYHITHNVINACQSNNAAYFYQNIRLYHHIMTRLGVVPDNVCAFIDKWQSCGGSAKLCGSGSVKGAKAGSMIAFASQIEDFYYLRKLCNEFGYQILYSSTT